MKPLKLLAPMVVAILALSALPSQAQPGLLEPGLQGAVHYQEGDFWKYDQQTTPARTPRTWSTAEIYVRELGDYWLPGEQEPRTAWHQEWFVNSSTDVSSASSIYHVNMLETEVYQQRLFLPIDDPDLPLAEVYSEMRVRSNLVAEPETRSNSFYRPPFLQDYIFPFAVGDEWLTRSTRSTTEHDRCPDGNPPCTANTDLEYTLRVLRREPVRIESANSTFNGRSFDAWVVEKDYSGSSREKYELLWYVPAFCAHVKRQYYQDDDQGTTQLQFTEWLTDGRCTATVPAVQPTYRLTDPQNFSSTRLHGAPLSTDDAGPVGNEDRQERAQRFTPAPAPLAGLALIALAALFARRRR